MKDGGAMIFVAVWLFICTVFSDVICMILVGVYFGLGKDEECSINAKAYMLAYIIIKIFLLLSRLIWIGIGIILRDFIGIVLHFLSFYLVLLEK